MRAEINFDKGFLMLRADNWMAIFFDALKGDAKSEKML